MMKLPTDPAELFLLKEELSRLVVLGPWQELNGHTWIRQEAGRPTSSSSRIAIWLTPGGDGLDAGWYYRLGFGVLCISGVENRTPYPNAESCMAAVDFLLGQVDAIVFKR
jgi:hypothetical protein